MRWAGRLDVLVCNAGVWHGGRLAEIDHKSWWSVLHANLAGVQHITRAAIGPLRRSPVASVLVVSSVVGQMGFPGDTAYASSKAALIGFAKSLAKEEAWAGVRVNVLAPGFVETDMTSGVEDGVRSKILDRTLLGRFGTTDEIANAAVFLALDGTFCTGTVLTIDGGWSL